MMLLVILNKLNENQKKDNKKNFLPKIKIYNCTKSNVLSLFFQNIVLYHV
jgi:hypothetical protein